MAKSNKKIQNSTMLVAAAAIVSSPRTSSRTLRMIDRHLLKSGRLQDVSDHVANISFCLQISRVINIDANRNAIHGMRCFIRCFQTISISQESFQLSDRQIWQFYIIWWRLCKCEHFPQYNAECPQFRFDRID